MKGGELHGNIFIDTLQKEHLYGLGPMEFLQGELLISDGIAYRATIQDNSSVIVETSWKEKAPFFVYSYIPSWQAISLPSSVISLPDLEKYIDTIASSTNKPFCFKLTGKVERAVFHVQNLPLGTKVSSPEDAHKHKKFISLHDEPVEIIGFFSRTHQTIFTHHDSYVHLHIINAKKTVMGHVDSLRINPQQLTLYLPNE
jgi:acetolactate decarboxylase